MKPNPPRPCAGLRHVWAPGIQYEGETEGQMLERERRLREHDEAMDREEERLYRWKITPWWKDAK